MEESPSRHGVVIPFKGDLVFSVHLCLCMDVCVCIIMLMNVRCQRLHVFLPPKSKHLHTHLLFRFFSVWDNNNNNVRPMAGLCIAPPACVFDTSVLKLNLKEVCPGFMSMPFRVDLFTQCFSTFSVISHQPITNEHSKEPNLSHYIYSEFKSKISFVIFHM